MKRNQKLATWLGLLCGIATASRTYAAVIYSNFGPGDSFFPVNRPPVGSGIGVTLDPGGGVDGRAASSFTTGPFQWNIDSVQLALGFPEGSNTFEMMVMTDSGGVPGQVLQTVFFSGVTLDASIITVSGIQPLLLESNTTYWIALAATITDSSDISSCIWLLNNTRTGSGSDNGGGGAIWIAQTYPAPAMRVNGTIVPEPVSIAAAGLTFLGVFRRNRRMTSAF
ncbi:MAG TPA: choice-of-anchor R domain-containing protein [Tepidisphaeraceae bacterium]|jgi:hypothetical protein|nr:choice-of-anchor R domain-containing protein [Tepidisphaeraceae bacterium]